MTGSASPTAAVPSGTGEPPSFDRRLLGPMVLSSILNPVNSSIIAVALVPIATAFGAPASQTAWLVSALYLATSIGQPLVGRLVDTFGPRRLLLTGAALTVAAGLLGALAPDLGVLVAARVVLGFGTCAGYPASMYLVRSEAQRTGRASPAGVLTVLSVATQTTAVIGPTLGGLLIGLGGWRATFAVNVPLGLACLVLGAVVLPRHTVLDSDLPVARRGLDVPGILAFAATLVALLLFLLDVEVARWWLLAIAAVAGTLFVVRERRVPDPFVDVRVLGGNVPQLLTYVRALLAALVSYSFLYGFTQWLEQGRGLSPSVAGLVLLPVFGIGILGVTLTGRRPEIRAKLLVAATGQAVACALLLLLSGGTALWLILGVAVVMGIPQGLGNLAIQNALFHQADPTRIGASSGLLRTFSYLGAIGASAVSGAAFGARADTHGLHELATFALVAAGLFLVVTVFDRSLARVDRAARGELTRS